MPTYDYRCAECGHEFEHFQSMSSGSLRKCPVCSRLTLKRLMGTGAGIIFKGSGFYETDYKRKSSNGSAKHTHSGGNGTAKDGSESKAESKLETGRSDSAKPDKSESAKTESKKGKD